ncbi:MAG: alpha-galactosidase [Kiritimatiellae bacterium]|nr:alpha-galactosidase [Kiritimatiellia bacterium]
MAKITFIGAGSFGFTRNLVKDILTFPLLRGSTLVLMDIDRERLAFIKKAVERIVMEGKYPAKVVTTTNRRAALEGADAVICTILAGGVDVWQHDILIPKKFGVDMNVGDTRSVAGVFRALRTIPVMLGIGRDMEELCPDAILLNYTNPMAMLCRALQRETKIKVTGLCHSVQGTARDLAGWIKAPMDEITYLCAGINHQSWFLKFERNRRDAYPLLRRAMKDKKIRNAEQVRNEMFLQLGYYVTESSGHNSEYNWWFRKRPDLIKKYCTRGTAWNPGHYAFILRHYRRQGKNWKQEIIKKWLNNSKPLDLKRGLEYAASIINAYMGGETFEFNGNVPNTGIIPNLPQNVCVEVPVFANRRGFNPAYVGPLPPQCAALNNASIAVEEMAVEAAITGDPRLVFHAVAYDPLSAAVLSLEEIREMTQAMLIRNRPYLPQFRNIRIK